MKGEKSSVIALFVIACILLNCGGKWFADAYSLPVWLDSVGTILMAYMCGSVCGAIVGVSVNILFSFSNPVDCVYAATSLAIAVTVGICARKRAFRHFFGTMNVSFLVSILSVVISTPLNYIFNGGYTGNVWGDGVIDYLLAHDVNVAVSRIAGEFYVDFLDKTLILCLFYLGLRFYHSVKCRRGNGAVTAGTLALCLAVCR